MTPFQIDLNLLIVLHTVLAERSVTRAARRLHVTSSAISNSLARLRQALGDPLLVRSGRGVVPTPRATALMPALARALGDLDHAIHGDAFDAASTTSRFTLAIADAGQVVQVPLLASSFAASMPRATLRIVGIDTLLSSGGLAGTEVDLALAAMEDRAPGIHLQPLYEERSVLVARRGHSLAAGPISKRQLGTLRHVDVEVAPGKGYRQLASAYARLGVPREVALVVPSFVAAASVISETDFVATLPESLLRRFGKAFRLSPVKPAPRVAVAVKLAWHDRTEHDPAMIAFRTLVEASVRSSRQAAAEAPRR